MTQQSSTTDRAIRYNTAYYHSHRDLIQQGLDPDGTLRDAISEGRITRDNVADEAASHVAYLLETDPPLDHDEDCANGGPCDACRQDGEFTATDLERYLRSLLPLRERGVYRIPGFDGLYVVACAGDDGGYVLDTPDEWLAGDTADWEIDVDGVLTFQGDRARGGGILVGELEDTGFDATADTFEGQIGVRPSMGTDWPVIAVISRTDPGQTDEGEPVAWWVNTRCNGSYDGEGGGTTTFGEAVAYATSDDE